MDEAGLTVLISTMSSKIGSITVLFVARRVGTLATARLHRDKSPHGFRCSPSLFFVVVECKQVGLNFPRSLKDFVSKVVLVKVSVIQSVFFRHLSANLQRYLTSYLCQVCA